jgi:nitroreductase
MLGLLGLTVPGIANKPLFAIPAYPTERSCPGVRDFGQSIILACRGFGLGTVITTNHIRCEGEIKTLLGIPEEVATFALMPIGWPIDRFGPLTRRPLSEVAHVDRWGDSWPHPPPQTDRTGRF